MWGKNEDRIFKRYFIMYFFVLLVPMIICCTYYFYVLLMINSDDISARKNDLVHAASRFDVVASEIDYLGDCLVTNVEVNLFKNICGYINKQKNMRDGDMIANGIISFIDARYSDPNLSLALLADQFEISQPYLSSLFKQTQGINLSTYIENIRIQKAKDFLDTTDLTINKISEMVGYGSTNSFCRAFKRVTGVSTSEYRKKASLGTTVYQGEVIT